MRENSSVWVSVILVALIIVGYLWAKQYVYKLAIRISQEKGIPYSRALYVSRVMTLMMGVLALIFIGMTAGINYEELSLFFASAFAVIGVALFAQWSILSNITASVIVFFFFPYRVGDKVKIMDGDNSIEGVIDEIRLFHVVLKGEKEELLTYPNSMVFQKAVIINRQSSKSENNHDENGDW